MNKYAKYGIKIETINYIFLFVQINMSSYTLPPRALPCRALPSRALPCRALPSRALPCRALSLIREYSRPMTKPDWYKSKPIITTYRLYLYLLTKIDHLKSPDINIIILNNISCTEWYFAYTYIKHYGLMNYLFKRQITSDKANMDGLQDAQRFYMSTDFKC